jgi:MHS family proline/betaine transporter-like MFS transporter
VLSVAYNVSVALLGGTTPLIAVWLVSGTGVALAPAMYLAGAAALTFVGAPLLPKTPQHSLTKEFKAARFRKEAPTANRPVPCGIATDRMPGTRR